MKSVQSACWYCNTWGKRRSMPVSKNADAKEARTIRTPQAFLRRLPKSSGTAQARLAI